MLLDLNSCYFDSVATETEPGCSSGKRSRSTRRSNGIESNGVAELDSKITSSSAVADKISVQATVKRRRRNEASKEAVVGAVGEIKTETDNAVSDVDKENHDPEQNQEELKENPEKRRKVENDKKMSESKSQDRKTAVTIQRCEYCRQKLNDDIKLYQGHPNGALEEDIALIDPKLCVFMGDESFIDASDERPQNKLTHFR